MQNAPGRTTRGLTSSRYVVAVVDLPTVTADELHRKLENGDTFVLVDALPPMAFAHSHLPGAINLPPSAIETDIVLRRIPDQDMEVAVYCANPDCDDSHATARRLRELGYTNVRHYSGGKNEWREAGLPLERAGKPYVPKQHHRRYFRKLLLT